MRIRLSLFAVAAILMSLLSFTAIPAAYAQDEAEEEQDSEDCSASIPTKNILLTLGVLVVGTGVMATVGMNTWSRSLAAGGHRQTAANMAGMGLGALIGGGAASGVFAAQCGGIGYWPGMLSVAVAIVGLVMMIAGAVTGKT